MFKRKANSLNKIKNPPKKQRINVQNKENYLDNYDAESSSSFIDNSNQEFNSFDVYNTINLQVEDSGIHIDNSLTFSGNEQQILHSTIEIVESETGETFNQQVERELFDITNSTSKPCQNGNQYIKLSFYNEKNEINLSLQTLSHKRKLQFHANKNIALLRYYNKSKLSTTETKVIHTVGSRIRH